MATRSKVGGSKFVDGFNAQVEKNERANKRPRRGTAGEGASSLLSPPSDHDMYMKRASYQNIFKDITEGTPKGGGGDARQPSGLSSSQNPTDILAAAAAVASATNGHGRKGNPPPLKLRDPGNAAAHAAAQALQHTMTSPMTPQLQMQMQQVMQLQAQARAQQAGAAGGATPGSVYTPQSGGFQGGVYGDSIPGTPMSPVSATDGPPSDKKATRLEKNRKAAKECRRKKKEYVEGLEARCRELEAKYAATQMALEAARASMSLEQKAELNRFNTIKDRAFATGGQQGDIANDDWAWFCEMSQKMANQ